MKLIALVMIAVAQAAPPPPVTLGTPRTPGPHTDHFRVDAAVGGVVRRDLREIGKAVIQYVDLPGAFRMRGAAQVEHREKKKTYRFQLDMTFRAQGRRLEVVDNKSRFSEDSKDIREKVERVVPFFYLLRTLPVPAEAEEPSRTWLARHGYFVLRYQRREEWVEATLHQDDELVGRFRLGSKPGRSNDLDRIEIPAAQNVMVLFTRRTGPDS